MKMLLIELNQLRIIKLMNYWTKCSRKITIEIISNKNHLIIFNNLSEDKCTIFLNF